MIYTPLTKKAIKIAYAAHHGQTDKSGLPYICHPLHLAEEMEDEYSCCAALLHDVVEDTQLDFPDLERLGFPSEVLDALRLLTHHENTPYMDYVRKIKPNPIARAVKLADLRHNSDLTRLNEIDSGSEKRLEKYLEAMLILSTEAKE